MDNFPYVNEELLQVSEKNSRKMNIVFLVDKIAKWEKKIIYNQILVSMLIFTGVFLLKFSSNDFHHKIYKDIINASRSEKTVEYIKNIIPPNR